MASNAYLATTTTAAVALLAAANLLTSGVTARSAAGEQTGTASADASANAWPGATEVALSTVGPVSVAESGTQVADASPETRAAPPKEQEPLRSSRSASREPVTPKGQDDLFRSDPKYSESYDAQENVDVYGAKTEVTAPRPLLELGRPQYTSGLYEESGTLFGAKNPLLPGLSIYGDMRTAVAYNNNNTKEIAQIATRLNIDVDFKITGTERLHAFFTPIQRGNADFTRFEFGGADGDKRFTSEFDLTPQTLFFEGDAGSIYSGFSGQEASFDLPFVFGLYPLFLQNGIWANDAILGGAVSFPAKNSAALGLSNFDITLFAGFDNIDNPGIIGAGANDRHNANLLGATTFIDAFSGYIEAGYGLIQGRDEQDGLLTHFLTAAYTRRYLNFLSNSTRVFANFGDDPKGSSNGFALISENSLVTSLPSTLVPYANFFVGVGNPQPLVDGNGAGILKNVGINFETDALTGYPKLDDSGSNAFGGALGLQYLFNLDQQIAFEVAMVQPFEDDGIGARHTQVGVGVRYQIPITDAWLFRADATYQFLTNESEDNFGIRAEVRRKF